MFIMVFYFGFGIRNQYRILVLVNFAPMRRFTPLLIIDQYFVLNFVGRGEVNGVIKHKK